MDERLALDEIGRMDRRVRAQSSWYGVFCLIIAISAAAWVIVSHLLGADHIAVAWLIVGTLLILGAILWIYGRCQLVLSRSQAHFALPMGVGYVVLMFVAITLQHSVLPDGFSIQLALVALLPAAPCLIGAWKVFRP